MFKRKSNFIFFALALGLLVTLNSDIKAQDGISSQNKLKEILSNFNNFRFSSVSFYEMNDRQVRSLKEIIKKKTEFEEEAAAEEENIASSQNVVDPERLENIVNEVRKVMATGTRSLPAIRRAFNGDIDQFEYLEDLEVNDVELQLAYQQAIGGTRRQKADIYQMFMITKPVEEPGTPPDIIALILCKERIAKDEYEEYLIAYYNQVIGNAVSNEKNILTYHELMNFMIEDEDDATKTTNLYDKLIVEFRQGNFNLITPEVRGIGSELVFVKNYGKTSTKELIASVLSQRYKVLKTYKNFNNQIGVPLTMLQFDSTHQAAVVEIGTNSPGEISLLSELLKPDLGVITNIGKEHLEQLIDLEQVEIEETFLFGNLMKTGGVCFINCDDQRLAKYKNILKNSITYGTDKSQKNDFNVEIELKNDLKPSLSFNINDENFVANLNAVGYAIALNATAAIPIGAYLGLTGSEIKVGLEAYKENSTEQSYARMALQNIGKFLFLNDCYNANPDSMLMSIKTLLAYKQAKKHIAILGDMFELGEATEEEHSNVLENASNSLYKVLVTGKNMEQTAQKNKRNNVIYFGTLEEIANYIKKLDDIENTVFLLKGSRGMKMENIFLYL
jgi:UDP-N-acetylmuramoyl-tripeptide--D-alanyl-D-alanine ligase